MKIAVMGAGAVGCYYGGMLARAGHAVVLVARPVHVEAIRQNGLLLDTQTFQERVQLQAETEARAVQGAQCVLFCVKSTDTESAGRAMAPYLGTDTVVLSLQNGVDNAERLQAVLQRPVLPAVVYVAAGMAGPGHVRHHGRGELVIAPSPPAATSPAALQPPAFRWTSRTTWPVPCGPSWCSTACTTRSRPSRSFPTARLSTARAWRCRA